MAAKVRLICMCVLCCILLHAVSYAATESGTDDVSGSSSGTGEGESAGDSADSGLADFVEGGFDGQEEFAGQFAPEVMEHLAMSPFHPM